ncbi:hypothetical protein A2982_01210 [candidate division WWE3 bacterium RIFCSPLOWO2_01_FULL_39_13]|uniref:DUF4012 domain-containing protein n=1 Tax=candidate division WWE3 bacterium RIFCSPLOWO2_01_FULL_39_13 TaxID=1802624 RepID=A0A1F4V2H6_UNCKA|nr:MAG: hypothetical protein A2982_01210 [candidate division WWE3 bacterium RIFCSPLOWO2_01_FULL_39_13]
MLSDQRKELSNFFMKFRFPKIPFNSKWFIRIIGGFGIFIGVILLAGYLFVIRPVLVLANEAKALKASLASVNRGVENMDFKEIKQGLDNTKNELENFKKVYEKNTRVIRKIPFAKNYYDDGNHFLIVADQGIQLGGIVVDTLEPYAADIGFSDGGDSAANVPAQERIVKLLKLMPNFSTKVKEISDSMNKINTELAQIDPSRYPSSLPVQVKYFRLDPNLNLKEQVLAVQSISNELAKKAPQFEALFNAIPEFMGLDAPKRYLILFANNYEIRMSGGFNTYAVVVEFTEGIPEIIYSIDTYFIDEGARTGSSALVNRNVPYFLKNYLYLSGNTFRIYARDATSVSPDFPTAANNFLDGFWRKDRSLPQAIDGVIQIDNDVAVDLLRIVGPVNTEKYSIKTDQGTYVTVPVTEFNADNVIEELENIAGGKLAETIGRKEIIRFLAQSIFEKIFTSSATNFISLSRTMLDSMSKKDVIMYSFDPAVETAFNGLGYSGRIKEVSAGWDYLHVNRSNFGSGKADWTKEGFVTQEVVKGVEMKDGKKIGTVSVTIKNPKRPSWYDIVPCCFYRAYLRVYVPAGSKLISASASDGQDAHSAEFADDILNKTFFETFTTQQKQTDLTINFEYELPDTVSLDDYHLLIQRQPGTSVDPYHISVDEKSRDVLLNADTEVNF